MCVCAETTNTSSPTPPIYTFTASPSASGFSEQQQSDTKCTWVGKSERERESSHFGSSRECSRSCRSHPPPAKEDFLPLSLLLSFFCLRAGDLNPGACLLSRLLRPAISEGYHIGTFARLEKGVRDNNIGAVGPSGDRRPTAGTFGSLTTTTSSISATLQGGLPRHNDPGHQLPRTGTTSNTRS